MEEPFQLYRLMLVLQLSVSKDSNAPDSCLLHLLQLKLPLPSSR
jgi:hypothetical protein